MVKMPEKAFSFCLPTRVAFGLKRVAEAGELSRGLGSRCMLFTGSSAMESTGVLDRVVESLEESGIEVLVSGGVESNPSTDDVDRASKEAVRTGVDFVIGLGGGSAIDVAKGVAIVSRMGGGIWDYIRTESRPARPVGPEVLPVVAIPSTAGTGTETTGIAVFTNRADNMKKGLGSYYIYPRISIVDPGIMVTMPKEITAYTGMDAFSQALEVYTSGLSNPATDLLALESLRYSARFLKRAYDDGGDVEARIGMAWASVLAGAAFGQIDVNLAHAMSHPISARYNTPHGLAVAVCTVVAMRYNMSEIPGRYAEVGRLLGSLPAGVADDEASAYAVDWVLGLSAHMNIPDGIEALGVDEEDLELFTEEAMSIGAIKTGPREVSADELHRLYREAY